MKLEDKIFYQDNSGVLYNGGCEEILRDISSESVDLIVTSPPPTIVTSTMIYGMMEWIGAITTCGVANGLGSYLEY